MNIDGKFLLVDFYYFVDFEHQYCSILRCVYIRRLHVKYRQGLN